MSSQKSPQAKTMQQETAMPVSADTTELKAKAHTSTSKEKFSAYFTIAAAAAGLISDGCK
jgi:hypothetical protein